MKRSSSTKILTTHVGSLPRPDGTDRAGAEDDAAIREMVKGVVARQRDIGIDVINEGEYTKGGDWLSYVDNRFGGFEARPPAGGTPLILQGKDREAFADFYSYASQRGTLFYEPGGQIKHARPHWVATAPITYRGADALKREIDNLPRGGRTGRRGVHHHHGAGEPRALPAQRVLQDAGGVRVRARRGDARPNTRPSSRPASSCRSTTPGWWRCGTASASRWASTPSANTARCGSRR